MHRRFPIHIITPSSHLPLHPTHGTLGDLGRFPRLPVASFLARIAGVGVFGISASGAVLAEEFGPDGDAAFAVVVRWTGGDGGVEEWL